MSRIGTLRLKFLYMKRLNFAMIQMIQRRLEEVSWNLVVAGKSWAHATKSISLRFTVFFGDYFKLKTLRDRSIPTVGINDQRNLRSNWIITCWFVTWIWPIFHFELYLIGLYLSDVQKHLRPLNTGRKLNVQKKVQLCTLNLRPVFCR